jgi:hypothetical protein
MLKVLLRSHIEKPATITKAHSLFEDREIEGVRVRAFEMSSKSVDHALCVQINMGGSFRCKKKTAEKRDEKKRQGKLTKEERGRT